LAELTRSGNPAERASGYSTTYRTDPAGQPARDAESERLQTENNQVPKNQQLSSSQIAADVKAVRTANERIMDDETSHHLTAVAELWARAQASRYPRPANAV
jgi:hypothetical protein